MCLQHVESAFDGYNRGDWCIFSVRFRFFSTSESKKKNTCATMPELHDCTSYNIQTQRGVKRQFTITHVGERSVDSGGESWAELSALKM